MNTNELVKYTEYNKESFRNRIALLDDDDQEDLKVYIIERLREDKDVMKLYNVNSNTSLVRLHGILSNLNHTNLIKAKAQQYIMILQGIFRFMEEVLSRGAYSDIVKGLADMQMKFMDMHRPAIMKMAEKAVATGDQGQLYSGIFRILDQLDPKTRIVVVVIGVALIYIVTMKLCGPEIAAESVNAFAQYMGCDTDKSQDCPSTKKLGVKVIGSAMGWFLNNSGDSDDEDDEPAPKRIESKKSKSKVVSKNKTNTSTKDKNTVSKASNKSKAKGKKSLDLDGFPEPKNKKTVTKTKTTTKAKGKKSLDLDGFPEMPNFNR